METQRLFERYRELQQYVGWTHEDAARIAEAWPTVEPHLPALIDDFYAEIELHPDARKVITGGAAQVERLKQTLRGWVRELFAGQYDGDYAVRRWKVGRRHVEIGLDQIYTNVALSRLRHNLRGALRSDWRGSADDLFQTLDSLDRLIDLDLAIIEDAYQAEQLERRSEEQRQLLAEAVRNLAEGVVITDADLNPPGPRILFANDAIRRITGYDVEELIGRSPRILQGRQTDRAMLKRLKESLAKGNTFKGEFINYRKDREPYHVELLISPVRDAKQRITHFVAAHRDVTDLKRAEEKAVQTARLAAIGQMVAGLAHESRNALQRSQACLEMLAMEVEDRPDLLDLVARVQRAQDDLHRLYEEVRDYAAPRKLDRQPCDLAHLWRDTWAHLKLQHEAKMLKLTEELMPEKQVCHVDPFAMGQVFRNVLENAISASPPEGEITVRCQSVRTEGRPAIVIGIRDRGPGIPLEVRERVFDPFYTTKTKGMGLGMAIAKRIVEEHGGSIAIGNAKLSGAEVLITLPRDAV